MVLPGKLSVPLTVTMKHACVVVAAALMLLASASVAYADQHGGGTAAATITAAASVSPSASASASATAAAAVSAAASATSLPSSGGAVFDPALSVLALAALLALAVSGIAARILLRSDERS